MNDLMIFDGNQVEVFELDGVVLFNPYHVGECLDMAPGTVRDHISRMSERQVVKLKNSDVTKSNIQNSNVGLTNFRKLHNTGENFLTESGVYKLVFKSRKPNAERFTDWIADEVLPAIRKTGGYRHTETNPQIEEIQAKTEYVREINNLIDRFNGDMRAVYKVLGVEGGNVPPPKKEVRKSI